MMISSRGRYALRVMIDLAEHNNGEYIPMKFVAERQGISLKYLEQILPVLSKNNLIECVHGKGGGYRLVRPANDYSVGEILRLTEGSLAPVTCLQVDDDKPCPNGKHCKSFAVWSKLNDIINEYLDGVSLTDVIEGHVE